MKAIKPALAFILLILWIYLLDHPISIRQTTLPAIGKFMSPFTGFWQNAVAPDVHTGEFKAEELSAKTQVVWDDRLVPHVFAEDERDAFYVSGYIIASQRLWQMDMLARSAMGRLAEVLGGERLTARDKEQRRMGMLFGAENAVIGWKKDSIHFGYIEAYCAGVNDYISQLKSRDLPLEYKLMGFTPEPWTPLKTAAIVKYMAQSLCSREYDLEATNTRAFLGDTLYNILYPEYVDGISPVIPAGTEWAFSKDTAGNKTDKVIDELESLYLRPNTLPPPGQGSNNWAVSGSKTKSGYPILCNDPHLRLTLPSIWFENQIKTPEFNAYGVSVPGIPGILIGFNENIAWGETNVGHDVADWYRIQWADENHDAYYLDGKKVPVTKKVEEIRVKNEKTIFDTVRYTSWGPVPVDDPSSPHGGLAYHWIAHETPQSFEMLVFLNLMKAKNYEDYYRALNGYKSPAQNFVFASKEGDIALTVNGNLPLKKQGQGKFVQDGSVSTNAWQGFIPYENIPRTKNPARGFVSSANQHSTDPSYPYYYNGDFEYFRGRTLNRLLESKGQFTGEDMMPLQNDNYSLKAEENLPVMLSLLDSAGNTDDDRQDLIRALRSWDFNFGPESKEANFFNTWHREMYRLIFDEWYGNKDSSQLQYPKMYFTGVLLKDEDHRLFDLKSTLDKTETARDIINLAFLQAWKDVGRDSGGNILPWSKAAKSRVQHLANLPGFSRENIEIGGVGDALNAMANGSGPSWRMIVELGEKPRARVIFPGGQNGNPGSRFYDNMIDDWAAGKYQEAKFIIDPNELKALFTQNFSASHE